MHLQPRTEATSWAIDRAGLQAPSFDPPIRSEVGLLDPNSFYGRLSAARGNDSPELILCVQNVVRKLINEETNAQRPGMLLGKI